MTLPGDFHIGRAGVSENYRSSRKLHGRADFPEHANLLVMGYGGIYRAGTSFGWEVAIKFSDLTRGRVARILGIIIVAGLLWGALSSRAIAAQPEPPATSAQPPSAESLEAWRKSMVATPRPTTGCFTASYLDTQWREVPCTTPPQRP
jgi:hypothetical protein